MPLIPFCETPFHDEYKRLAAIVGAGKLKSDHWDAWARLIDKYTWRIVIKSADRADPLNRWPSSIEAICLQLHRDEIDAEREWESRRKRESEPKTTNNAERAKLFSEIRKKVMQ